MNGIGIKVQDVKVGRKVFYYSYADDYWHSEPQEAVITSEPCEIGETLCCMISTQSSVVALSNLSFEKLPTFKPLNLGQRRAKERYHRYAHADGIYDGISFGDYLRNRMYED